MIRKYKKGFAVQISDNFVSTEFDCKCSLDSCKYTYISDDLVTRLEIMRKIRRVPLKVNSGYRCNEHNKNIGGAINSIHTKGEAADVDCLEREKEKSHEAAEQSGFDGIGKYNSFTHVDVRGWRARW